jgi:putative membrane protein
MRILTPNRDRPLHIFLWTISGIVFIWSYIGCVDRLTWIMEVAPVILGTIVLIAIYPSFRFSRLVCWFLCIHAIVLMIGGHYTYAEVPLFNWLRDTFDLSRNYYDRVGHFLQGFVPALIAREALIRLEVIKRSRWLNFVIVCICLAISAAYELVEWQAAVWTGSKADAFLGTQGDPWDTQWDMAMALIGAFAAIVFLPKIHDRSMKGLHST